MAKRSAMKAMKAKAEAVKKRLAMKAMKEAVKKRLAIKAMKAAALKPMKKQEGRACRAPQSLTELGKTIGVTINEKCACCLFRVAPVVFGGLCVTCAHYGLGDKPAD